MAIKFYVYIFLTSKSNTLLLKNNTFVTSKKYEEKNYPTIQLQDHLIFSCTSFQAYFFYLFFIQLRSIYLQFNILFFITNI